MKSNSIEPVNSQNKKLNKDNKITSKLVEKRLPSFKNKKLMSTSDEE